MRGRTSTRTRWLAIAAALTLALGCTPDGGDDDDDGAGGGSGDGGLADMALPNVPYEGQIDPLPAESTVDEQSYFPTPAGGVWRYRRQAPDPAMPPPVTEGGERRVEPGEGENEWIMTTVVVLDVPVDGEVTKVRQVIRETLVVVPEVELVGPQVLFKRLDIEEREIGTERFVRTLTRTYNPPYQLVFDTWKTGLIGNRLQPEGVQMVQTSQARGDEEPAELMGIVTLSVETTSTPLILVMEGAFREGVHRIDVVDDFSGMVSRTYWVQQGVGIVQWQYRDTNNIIYTLTESNVEAASAE
ncbi:MAG: hypothetical protein R3F65_22245 [bacterium]